MFDSVVDDDIFQNNLCFKHFQQEFLAMQRAILDLEDRVEELEFSKKQLENKFFSMITEDEAE